MQHRTWSILLAVCLFLSLGVASVATPAVAHEEDYEPRVHITLAENGTAYISIADSYDLHNDEENETFNTITGSQERANEELDSYRDSIERGVAAVDNRDVAIVDEEVAAYKIHDGEMGLVVSRFEVENFAAVAEDAGQLSISEPLQSMDVDRRLIIEAPEGYAMEEATPYPNAIAEDGQGVVWLSSADSFEHVVFTAGGETPEIVDEGESGLSVTYIVGGVGLVVILLGMGFWFVYSRRV